MKLVYKQPNFKFYYEVSETSGLIVSTFVGPNPQQSPQGSLDDIFEIVSNQIEKLFACLGTPKLNQLLNDEFGNFIRYRFKASNANAFAEVRVNFDSNLVYAQCIVNHENMCRKSVVEEFKKIVSTAIAMSVEL